MSEFNISEIREKINALGETKIQELSKNNAEVQKLLGEATSENGLVEFLEEINENNDNSVTQAEIETYATKKGTIGNLQSLIEGIKNIFEQIMSIASEPKPTDEVQADATVDDENAENTNAGNPIEVPVEDTLADEIAPEAITPTTDVPTTDVPTTDVPTADVAVVAPPASTPVVDSKNDIDAKADTAKADAAVDKALETLAINNRTYTKDFKNNETLKNHPPVETVSLPTFNSETSKYLDPSFETALNAKQARIKALNEEILLAMQKEQNEYITRYNEVEDAKKKLAEYEGKLKEEGISDEDKTKLKTDIASLKEFINGGVNSLDSSIGSVASKIQERTSAINECNEIVKSGNEQAKQISELVDKAQGVNFDSKIAEVNKIEVKKQGNGVDVSGDRSNYYSPEDENSVNAKSKNISDAQIQVDNVKKALEDNNAKIKNDQTSLSKIVGDIANMSAADKTKALESIKGLAGGILTSGDKVGVDINNLKNVKNNVNLSVEQYDLAVQAANTNISAIKKAVEDARNVQFEEKVDYYADDIKLAAEKSVNTKNGRDKYYSEDDKNKVGAKQKELDDAKAATKKAQEAYDENNGKLKNSQQSLEDLIASLATASGDAKTAALNKIKQLTGTIMASGETMQNNIEAYKTAKSAQSTAINSYNNAVDTANANIDAAVAAAVVERRETNKDNPGIGSNPPAEVGTGDKAEGYPDEYSRPDGVKIKYVERDGKIYQVTTDKDAKVTEKEVKGTPVVENVGTGGSSGTSSYGTKRTVTYADGSTSVEYFNPKNSDGSDGAITLITEQSAKKEDGNYTTTHYAYKTDGEKVKTSEYVYDKNGNQVNSKVYSNETGKLQSETSVVYDPNNKKNREVTITRIKDNGEEEITVRIIEDNKVVKETVDGKVTIDKGKEIDSAVYSEKAVYAAADKFKELVQMKNKYELREELLKIEPELLEAVKKVYESEFGGNFEDTMFNAYTEYQFLNTTHKFKNYSEQMELAKKLYSPTADVNDVEMKKQVEIDRMVGSLLVECRGSQAKGVPDDTKQELMDNLASMSPSEIQYMKLQYDKKVNTNISFKGDRNFETMLKDALSKNWEGAFKWNDQNLDAIKNLARAGIYP